jgi:hypothetical protein
LGGTKKDLDAGGGCVGIAGFGTSDRGFSGEGHGAISSSTSNSILYTASVSSNATHPLVNTRNT